MPRKYRNMTSYSQIKSALFLLKVTYLNLSLEKCIKQIKEHFNRNLFVRKKYLRFMCITASSNHNAMKFAEFFRHNPTILRNGCIPFVARIPMYYLAFYILAYISRIVRTY